MMESTRLVKRSRLPSGNEGQFDYLCRVRLRVRVCRCAITNNVGATGMTRQKCHAAKQLHVFAQVGCVAAGDK